MIRLSTRNIFVKGEFLYPLLKVKIMAKSLNVGKFTRETWSSGEQ